MSRASNGPESGGVLAAVQRAGIVGCGGAGFPTHAKLKGDVQHLILNGAECEPLLRTDRYLMVHHAQEIVSAAVAVGQAVGAQRCTIALKASYQVEIAALERAIQARKAAICLHRMSSFYPAGDEQVLVAEVTGQTVPPAGIPLDVGCAVCNVGTMYQISLALEGENFTHKYLTVTGAVSRPTVIRVPLGTSFAHCLELAGGIPAGDWLAIAGGPMMGRRLTRAQALVQPVLKTTSGILILPPDSAPARLEQLSLSHLYQRARSACIQCRSCTDLCPRHLLGHPLEPHRIMRELAALALEGRAADSRVLRSAALCCECGVCEIYACPMGLQPRRLNALIKRELAAEGVRWPKGEGQCQLSPMREGRRAPTRRVAARAGVLEYDGLCGIERLVQGEPDQVTLPLGQHIGAPAAPAVAVGDRVTVGQCIAVAPEGALSAHLHASIDGVVISVGDAIVIRKGD